MNEPIVISNIFLIKALGVSLTTLISILIWLFKEMNSNLKEIRNTLLNIMTMFAPRDETNERIVHLGTCMQDLDKRTIFLEEWRKSVDNH